MTFTAEISTRLVIFTGKGTTAFPPIRATSPLGKNYAESYRELEPEEVYTIDLPADNQFSLFACLKGAVKVTLVNAGGNFVIPVLKKFEMLAPLQQIIVENESTTEGASFRGYFG